MSGEARPCQRVWTGLDLATIGISKGPMRTGLAVLVVSCLAAVVIAQNPTPQGGQVFRSGSRTVAVYVTVSDEQGRLVPDLTQDDFEIYDNGKKQTITLFENGMQPITLVMMLD